MGRLIDESLLQEKLALIPMEERTFRRTVEELENAPTVDAIPKAEVKKFLEEGTKNISNNVLAIIREDYIHKADYENRLKTDLAAMLTEILLECEENTVRWYVGRVDGKSDDVVLIETLNEIIQQKINSLRGNKDVEI